MMLFERIHTKDIVTWNSIITGFAQNGRGEQSLSMFYRMMEENEKPNHVTFLGVLSGCSHLGMICEGLKILASMGKDFNVIPRADHYAVMIDLLGRQNRLEDALDLVLKAPTGSNHVGMWVHFWVLVRYMGTWNLQKWLQKLYSSSNLKILQDTLCYPTFMLQPIDGMKLVECDGSWMRKGCKKKLPSVGLM